MHSIIHQSDSFKTTHWGGGSTTEFIVYPESASYIDRDFSFRLSMATVEIEKSDFTPLPGVSRTLMILDGSMHLKHEGQHSVHLNKFDFDNFEGGWHTVSEGCCTDFNLMTMDSCSGELQGRSLSIGELLKIEKDPSFNHYLVFIYKGEVNVEIAEEKSVLKKRELLQIAPEELASLSLISNVESELVIVRISEGF